MKALRDTVGFLLPEVAPLPVFYALLALGGLKAAIAGTIGFVALDLLRRRIWHVGVTRLYLFTSALILVFGAIDLSVATPFMLKYEAVISSVAVGAVFAAGARGKRPVLMEVAERQGSETIPDRPDVVRFFRLLTLFWAAYFLIKAVVFLWIAQRNSLTGAMAWRSVISPVSLAVMFAISLQGRRLFGLCRRLGLLPAVPASPSV